MLQNSYSAFVTAFSRQMHPLSLIMRYVFIMMVRWWRANIILISLSSGSLRLAILINQAMLLWYEKKHALCFVTPARLIDLCSP